MKIRTVLLIVAALMLAVVPAFAQDMATNSVTFNGVGFQFDAALASGVNIHTIPGDPTDLEQPGGPQVAHTEFQLYNDVPSTDSDMSQMNVVGTLHVYDTANFAGYELASAEWQSLQTLLVDRPDLAQNMVAVEDNSVDLPYLPVIAGSQIIRSQAHYLDTPTMAGVAYITAYRLDVSPLVATDFSYTFQGLSNDGTTYVSAVFPVTASAFPLEIAADFDYDAFSQGFIEYLTESIGLLNQAGPQDIAPPLASLDALVQTITFGGMSVPTPAPEGEVVAPTPEAEPTQEDIAGQDLSLGGLAGTWRLTQYGNPAEPTPVIEGSEVTLTFETSGLSGNAGCNSYSGAFVYDGTNLTVSDVVSTLRACVDEAVQTQETNYLNALGTVTGFQVGDASLRLIYPEGELVYEAVPAA